MTTTLYGQLLNLTAGALLLTAVLVLWRRELPVIVRVFGVQGVALAGLIGVLAAFQRGYLTDQRDVRCKQLSDTVLTVVAGPDVAKYTGKGRRVREASRAVMTTPSPGSVTRHCPSSRTRFSERVYVEAGGCSV